MVWNPEKGFLPAPNVEKIVSKISALPKGLDPKSESKNKNKNCSQNEKSNSNTMWRL